MEQDMALSQGDRVSNYLLEAQVGVGSFGEVWRARHHVFDKVVAVKVPTDPEYVADEERAGDGFSAWFCANAEYAKAMARIDVKIWTPFV